MEIQPLPKNLKATIKRAFVNNAGSCYAGLEVMEITDTYVWIRFTDFDLTNVNDPYDIDPIAEETIIYVFEKVLEKYFEKATVAVIYTEQLLREVQAENIIPCVDLEVTRERVLHEWKH